MVELADNPIRFYVKMNNEQLNKVEYYCGIDSPGCYIKVNKEKQQKMRSHADPEDLPRFQRGETVNDFGGSKWWSTSYTLYAGIHQVPVAINITYDKRVKSFTMICDKKKVRMARVTKEMILGGESIKMIENVWNMKLQAWLNKGQDSFILHLNGKSIYSHMRFDPRDQPNDPDGKDSNEISAKVFEVNDKAILQPATNKTIRGWEITLERLLEEAKEETAYKIVIEDLVCNSFNFV